MTPELAAATFIQQTLLGSLALTAMLADVDTYGAAIFPEELPEGDQYLPALVFNQGASRDSVPMGTRYLVELPFILAALSAGELFPHNIAEAADIALHDARGVVGGYAIVVARAGSLPPTRANTDKRKYRGVLNRYMVGISPST